jgi:hypothetical protein
MKYDFQTNIALTMPHSGKVYAIDRMTSDYAEAHPFDLAAFINEVHEEFKGTEFEESKESLMKVWNSTLSMPVQGDARLYPNRDGAHRAAAMKVWHLAGDYWRRGFKLGDKLPDRVPLTRITRTAEGWISLFPKDLELLTIKL